MRAKDDWRRNHPNSMSIRRQPFARRRPQASELAAHSARKVSARACFNNYVNNYAYERKTETNDTPKGASSISANIVEKNPKQLKFDFALWTRRAVRALIKRVFKVDISLPTIFGRA